MGDQFLALSEGRRQSPHDTRHFGLVVDDRSKMRELAERAWATMVDGSFRFFDPWGSRSGRIRQRPVYEGRCHFGCEAALAGQIREGESRVEGEGDRLGPDLSHSRERPMAGIDHARRCQRRNLAMAINGSSQTELGRQSTRQSARRIPTGPVHDAGRIVGQVMLRCPSARAAISHLAPAPRRQKLAGVSSDMSSAMRQKADALEVKPRT